MEKRLKIMGVFDDEFGWVAKDEGSGCLMWLCFFPKKLLDLWNISPCFCGPVPNPVYKLNLTRFISCYFCTKTR